MPGVPPDLGLRELKQSDVGAIAELIGACDVTYFDFAPQGWRPPSLSEETAKWTGRLKDVDRWSRGAFGREGRLIAFAAMRQARRADDRDEPVPGVGHLGALFVHPERWREGIARVLLDLAESAMRERQFHTGWLRTPERAPARRFYEQMGWAATGESWYREDFGMTVIGYEKRLVDLDP